MEEFGGFEEDVAGDAESFGGDLVESVLGSVPVGDVIGGVEVDDVEDWDVAAFEREMVVATDVIMLV